MLEPSITALSISLSLLESKVKAVKKGNRYTWTVVDANPADAEHKVGDEYTIATIKTTSGAEVYDFTWGDEGATHGRYVFRSNDSFVTIEIPYIWNGEDMEGVAKAETDAYADLSRKILDTLTIF